MVETELGGYRVVTRLAVGGMAEVYSARPTSTTERVEEEPDEVALKRLLPNHSSEATYREHFVKEARLCVRLRHPNIVRTFKLFRSGSDYLMVQELVTGLTVARLQLFLSRAKTRLPPAAAVYIVRSVLEALHYLHRARVGEGGAPIIHRDINPANVLLSRQGEVKLTDFGVADIEGVMGGESGALRGTIPYMSPEQVAGESIDARSDLFSAGILLWELLEGRKLYVAENPFLLMQRVREAIIPPLAPELPANAAKVVRHALRAERTRRFQTAAGFIRALDGLCRREGWTPSAAELTPYLEDLT